LYSLERGRERHIIRRTWKLTKGLASNYESETYKIVLYYNGRSGRLCRIPQSISELWPEYRLFERDYCSWQDRCCLLTYLRCWEGEFTLATFRRRLDKFLRKIPDRPVMGNNPPQVISNNVFASPGPRDNR
jgi:hypothetical protein